MNYGRLPTGPLNSLLDRRSRAYTIYEETDGNEGWNDNSGLTSVGTVEVDVHAPETAPRSYPSGETYETRLRGLARTDVDTDVLDNGNCLVYSGEVFELTIDAWPASDEPAVFIVALEERTDLTAP